MRKAELLRKMSVFKTMRLNFHYLGLKGLFSPKIIVARKVRIVKLGGEAEFNNCPTGGIRIGFGNIGIIDNRYQRSSLEVHGKLVFNGRCTIGVGNRIVVGNDGVLEFGDRVTLNGGSNIICYKSVKLGSEALVSWECLIMDTDFHKIMDGDGNVLNGNEAIIIGDHTWIGCRTTILKGSEIRSESVVAACSRVSENLPQGNCIYAGNKVIRNNITWEM